VPLGAAGHRWQDCPRDRFPVQRGTDDITLRLEFRNITDFFKSVFLPDLVFRLHALHACRISCRWNKVVKNICNLQEDES
jgi:hypothetical protein